MYTRLTNVFGTKRLNSNLTTALCKSFTYLLKRFEDATKTMWPTVFLGHRLDPKANATDTSVFTIGPRRSYPLTCETSRRTKKYNVREVASIILHIFMLYPEENNTINALNTMEKRAASPVIHCCVYLINIYNLGGCTTIK